MPPEPAKNIIESYQIWDIPGGIHPPENKTQSLTAPIAEAPLPSVVVLPLSMHIGAPAEPVVSVGDQVKTGQIVAKPHGLVSTAVHASVSGTVVAVEDRAIAHSSGMSSPCIVIESDGRDEWIELEETEDYRQLSNETIVERLRNAGLAGMGGAGFPTAVKLTPRNRINTLILNGTECEPYITADHALMRERAMDIIQGALLLAYALDEPQEILIGIEDNKPDAIEIMQQAASEIGDARVSIRTFPTKYPSGGEKQLIQILTGKEVKSGGLPSDIGIVLQNLGTAVAAWDAIRYGKPLISRVTTLVGESLQTQNNFLVRIGTSVADLLSHAGLDAEIADRIVMGGPMMGFSLLSAEVPVTKITNCLLAPTNKELPPPPPAQACIRCGICAEACPASLLPQQLFWYAQAEDNDKLQDYNLFDCIECGACAYVCPSNIPLVHYYRAAKGEIREEEREKVKADQSRIRFEARKERLEREAAERDAKRKARMEAAKAKQAAKAKEAEQAADGGTNADLVAQAMARVQAKQQARQSDPAEERAKLERQKATFEDRLEGIKGKIESAETDELKAKFEAQLKNTETKLKGVLDKLAQLEPPQQHSADGQEHSAGHKEQDAAAQAIEKARKKAEAAASMSPEEKLKSTLESLKTRRQKAADKVAEAEASGADTVDALKNGLSKLDEKITTTENELKQLGETDA